MLASTKNDNEKYQSDSSLNFGEVTNNCPV